MSKESIIDRITKMIMALDKEELHAGLIVLTWNDYCGLKEECKYMSSGNCDTPNIETFMGIPVAKTTRFESSYIITKETIDIVKSFEKEHKFNV